MIRCLASYSGGLVSHFAAMRWVERHGRSGLVLIFADTIIEDEDTYRFLIEGAVRILGRGTRQAPRLLARALALPTVESGLMDDRKRLLAELRADAIRAIPGLVWIADGRTPWEVFRKVRYVGNTRVDPCSKILKRQLIADWRDAHCCRDRTTLLYGLDWRETHRILDTSDGPGHRTRTLATGWRPAYLMAERPYLAHDDYFDRLKEDGIAHPRLYDMGFNHGNCGGYCSKMGHKQAGKLLQIMPLRYGWHEGEERETIAAIGPTARPFLRDRRGGKTKGITMAEFREKRESFPLLAEDDGDGCRGGCAID